MIAVYIVTSFCLGILFGTNIDSQAYVATQDNVITLEQDVGVMSNGWWEGNFTKAAKYHCGEHYTVLEKTENPSTLEKDQRKSHHYYWVIQCGK